MSKNSSCLGSGSGPRAQLDKNNGLNLDWRLGRQRDVTFGIETTSTNRKIFDGI